jgi:iron(III) transport system permease protein
MRSLSSTTAETEQIAVRSRPASHFADSIFAILGIIAAAFVLVFVVYPLIQILSQGFFRRGEFDLNAYTSVLTRPIYQGIIANSLVLGVIVSVLGTAIGFLFAYTIVRVPTRLRGILRTVALVPLVSPPFAIALSSILLFGRSGLITKGIFRIETDIYGLPGLTLVQVISFFPVSFLIFESLLKQLDASLEEAAQNLGAPPGHVFRTVTLRLLTPGIAASMLLLLIESMADLANPLLISGNFNVLASQSYIAIIGQSNFQLGAALSTVLLVPSLIAFLVQRWILARGSYISVTGRPTGGRILLQHRVAAITLTASCALIAALVVLLYATVFLGAITRVWGTDFTLTFEHFVEGYDRASRAITDTTMLAAIATPLTGLLGMVIAYLVTRGRLVGRHALDFMAMLGAAVPGTVLGIGFIIAFNRPPLLLTGTAAIIVICYVVRSLATGQRAAVAALLQIDPAIEEASTTLGADQATTFRRVTLPLIRGALVTGMIYTFAHSMTAISAIIFLTSPRWKVLTKEILDLVELGYLGNAIALTTILVMIVFGAMALVTYGVGRLWDSRVGPDTMGAAH